MCLAELFCELDLACPVAVVGVPGRCGAWQPGHLPDTTTMTKWFYSTRLETRTKESNIFASSWVDKPTCEMKVTTEMLASEAD